MKIEDIIKFDRIPDLKSEADRLRTEAQERLATAAEIDNLIAAAEALRRSGSRKQAETFPGMRFDEPQRQTDDVGPTNGVITGIPAIRAVMRENAGKPLKARQVYRMLERRGWLSKTARNPFHGVQSGLVRLADGGEIKRVSVGVYRYPAGGSSPSGEAESAVSVGADQ
jgi:hypothetical protein